MKSLQNNSISMNGKVKSKADTKINPSAVLEKKKANIDDLVDVMDTANRNSKKWLLYVNSFLFSEFLVVVCITFIDFQIQRNVSLDFLIRNTGKKFLLFASSLVFPLLSQRENTYLRTWKCDLTYYNMENSRVYSFFYGQSLDNKSC